MGLGFLAPFFAALGIIGSLAYVCLWVAMIVGWFMNLFKLFSHLPIFDAELIVRLLGLHPVIGGIVGWF